MRDGLSDYLAAQSWAEMLGLQVGQVNEARGVGELSKRQLSKNPHYTN
jgi:hypothetical protein